MNNIEKLAKIIKYNKTIDAYDSIGYATKQEFGKIGKKALKELATMLKLNEYNVNFNSAGVACSGDLRLMGFKKGKAKGIYINFNKNGICDWILYRTIENMNDWTGGINNQLPMDSFDNPESIVKAVNQLLRQYD